LFSKHSHLSILSGLTLLVGHQQDIQHVINVTETLQAQLANSGAAQQII